MKLNLKNSRGVLIGALLSCIIFSCSDDDNGNKAQIDYSTPDDIKLQLDKHLRINELTYDENGSAIDPYEVVIRFTNPGSFPSLQEKQQYLNNLGDEIAPGLILGNAIPCMCGDELMLASLDQTVADQEGGIIEVKPKLASTSGGVVEVTYNFYTYDELDQAPSTGTDAVKGNGQLSGTNDIMIAVLDSGIDSGANSEIQSFIWDMPSLRDFCLDQSFTTTGSFIGLDFIDYDTSPFDDHSHGTHVTNILYQDLSKIQNTTGNFFKYVIAPMKTHDQNGIGKYFSGVCAMYTAVKLGANVINASWGFYGLDEASLMEEAIEFAAQNNTVIVAGAGNNAFDLAERPFFPAYFGATHENVISVGAFDNPGIVLANFSNYHSTENLNVIAPGVDVQSYVPVWWEGSDQTQQLKSGTSMAAPQVSASVAYEIFQGKSIPEINSFLENQNFEVSFNGYNYVVYKVEDYY